MMKGELVAAILGILAGSCIVWSITIFVMAANTRDLGNDIRLSAIEAGVGEYYIDKNQDKQWRWIEKEGE